MEQIKLSFILVIHGLCILDDYIFLMSGLRMPGTQKLPTAYSYAFLAPSGALIAIPTYY